MDRKTPESKTQHKEAYYQKKILEWLRKTYPGTGFFWKAQAGPYCRGGIPDICGCLDGHFFGFEVKRPGGKPTELQKETIRQINAAGGTALIVTTVEQVKEAIDKWKTGTQERAAPK